MTPSDWLYEIRNKLQTVLNDNQVFSIGVRETLDNVEVSVTLTDQGDYLEAYVVSEPREGTTIEDTKDSVREVVNVIGVEEDYHVGTEANNNWAEVHTRVDRESVESL